MFVKRNINSRELGERYRRNQILHREWKRHTSQKNKSEVIEKQVDWREEKRLEKGEAVTYNEGESVNE